MATIDEFGLLNSFALRFDGYGWCEKHGKDSGELMNAYWSPETFDDLLSQPAEYRMAVMFLQQRSVRNMERDPDGHAVQLWRRLFLSLVDEEVPADFDGGFVYGGGLRVPGHLLPQLKDAIADRLEREAPLHEPLELKDTSS